VSEINRGAGRFEGADVVEPHWIEHGRSAHLSVGTYSIGAGQEDTQVPHHEDEIYVVTSGRARFVGPGLDDEVGPGSTIFVAAGEEHRFLDVATDFACLVIFAPPETDP
jgi:mannose-6-phosphate isomerase-like protein (cupin superfamily)